MNPAKSCLIEVRRLTFLTALLLLLPLNTIAQDSQTPGKADPQATESHSPQPPKDSIVNFNCPREGVATSGQPTEEGLEWIAKQGYKAVINFRTENEGVDIKAEAEHAKKLGMNYIHIPVSSSALSDDKVDAFMAAMKDPRNHPIFIHCASANRVGGFWMIYLVKKEGYSVDKAEEEARKVGLSNPKLVDFARDYLKRHPHQEKMGR